VVFHSFKRSAGLVTVALAIGALSATNVAAQTTTAQPTPSAVAVPAGVPPPAGGPVAPPAPGPGPGLAGPGGPLGGPVSSAALTQMLTTVKADRDAANGQMDLQTVNNLLTQAEQLIGQASSNLGSTDSTTAQKAQQQASAAQAEMHAAEAQMVQQLGSGLPSQANRPAEPTPPADAPSPQTRSSSDLAHTYQSIADEIAFSKANTSIDVGTPLTAAQGLYTQAYSAFQAGQFSQASQLAHAAGDAGHAAHSLLLAGGAVPSAVAVPAPNF
jgi:hypothetical protein